MNDLFYQARRFIPPEMRTAFDGTKRDVWIEDAIRYCIKARWLEILQTQPEYSLVTTPRGITQIEIFVSKLDTWIGKIEHCMGKPNCPKGIGQAVHDDLYEKTEMQGNQPFKSAAIDLQSDKTRRSWFSAMCKLPKPYLLGCGDKKARQYIRAASDKFPKCFLTTANFR